MTKGGISPGSLAGYTGSLTGYAESLLGYAGSHTGYVSDWTLSFLVLTNERHLAIQCRFSTDSVPYETAHTSPHRGPWIPQSNPPPTPNITHCDRQSSNFIKREYVPHHVIMLRVILRGWNSTTDGIFI